jgi:hypothetical protein
VRRVLSVCELFVRLLCDGVCGGVWWCVCVGVCVMVCVCDGVCVWKMPVVLVLELTPGIPALLQGLRDRALLQSLSNNFKSFAQCTHFMQNVCVCIFVWCLRNLTKSVLVCAKGQECGKVDWFVKRWGGGGTGGGGGRGFSLVGTVGGTWVHASALSVVLRQANKWDLCYQPIFKS